MPESRIPGEKREELIRTAEGFNRSLIEECEDEMLKQGGNLLLGRHYAESSAIYFSLNPGSYGGAMPFVGDFDGRSGPNPPFDSSDDYARKGYGLRWRTFLSSDKLLFNWFNNKVTSTFLCPWRTSNGQTLEKLNRATKDMLYRYSSQLVCKMIEDHSPKVLLIAGIKAVHLFNELMLRAGKRAWDKNVVNARSKGKKLAKHPLPEKGITVLQIPHFADRNLGNQTLESLAEWLRTELRPFGL